MILLMASYTNAPSSFGMFSISGDTALGVGYVLCKSIEEEKESRVAKLSDPDSGKPGAGEVQYVVSSTIGFLRLMCYIGTID